MKSSHSYERSKAKKHQTKNMKHGRSNQLPALARPIWSYGKLLVRDRLGEIKRKNTEAIKYEPNDKTCHSPANCADRQNLGELIERRQHAGHRPAIEQSQVFDDLRRKRNGRFERFDAMTLQIPIFPIALFRWFRHILFGRLSHSLPLFWEES
ncbi:hypothetical protein CPter91_3458 [Collimonas pratensis]|uniref:Uncharacterized protein n=1 Tax=Collimonas pratensis TaxID=279113 RepID=A0A127Q6Y6_9BURK|nr:hypothetical protein CPter91_3458 [Collimonas pratensis]